VLYFGRVVLRFRKITGALQAPAGKVLTYSNLLNVSAASATPCLGFASMMKALKAGWAGGEEKI
jgi:hypothetical protein